MLAFLNLGSRQDTKLKSSLQVWWRGKDIHPPHPTALLCYFPAVADMLLCFSNKFLQCVYHTTGESPENYAKMISVFPDRRDWVN